MILDINFSIKKVKKINNILFVIKIKDIIQEMMIIKILNHILFVINNLKIII